VEQSVPRRSDQQNVPCYSEEQSVPCHSEEHSDEESGYATPGRGAYADDLYCPDCGYSLRGLTSERCPECGLRLNFIESAVSLIPWERRRELGRTRAYWQTAWLASFRPKRFCRAAYQPVSYPCAQKFRWLTVAQAYVALLLVLGTLEALGIELLEELAEETGWWFVAFAGLCPLLALVALTGVPSYFFRPRTLPVERQNRAVALSYYGCALLGYALPNAAVLCMVLVGARLFAATPRAVVMFGAALVGGCFSGFVLLGCWLCWSRLARYALQRAGRRLLVTWVMPVVSLLVCGLILVGLPAIAYFVGLVVYSLRGVPLSG
jgi:hypothetical protein